MKETKKRKEKKIEKGMGVGDLRVKLVTFQRSGRISHEVYRVEGNSRKGNGDKGRQWARQMEDGERKGRRTGNEVSNN